MLKILPGSRLVQEDQFRLLHQHTGDGHALFLPEAQRRDRPVAEGIQPANFQRVLHAGAHFRLGQTQPLQPHGDLVIDHRLRNHLVGVLHHVADVLGAAADVDLLQVLPVEEDLPAVLRFKAADQLGQRGFARAVAPHDADHLALADGKADVLQRVHGFFVPKADIAHLQQGDGRGLGGGQRLGGEPALHGGGVGIVQYQGVDVGGALLRRDFHPGIAQRRQVQRLADAVFRQQVGA